MGSDKRRIIGSTSIMEVCGGDNGNPLHCTGPLECTRVCERNEYGWVSSRSRKGKVPGVYTTT